MKESKKLYFLRKNQNKAILIEYLFCSNKSNVNKYNPQKLAQASYNGLIGKKSNINNSEISRYSDGQYGKRAKIINVGADGLNIREHRGNVNGKVSSKAIGKLKEGSIVKVEYCINNWFSVWENGECGFIFGKYVKLI